MTVPGMTASGGGDWLNGSEVRLVRLYQVTGGRTRPTRALDLMTVVVATGTGTGDHLQPDHELALRLCGRPVSVAEVAGRMGMPVTAAKILLADLADTGALHTGRPLAADQAGDRSLLEKVLHGLQRL